MSGHGEDPVEEESKRFFTFFNLSMALVAITGIEIVIIYVQVFESISIIGILFTTSIVAALASAARFSSLLPCKMVLPSTLVTSSGRTTGTLSSPCAFTWWP